MADLSMQELIKQQVSSALEPVIADILTSSEWEQKLNAYVLQLVNRQVDQVLSTVDVSSLAKQSLLQSLAINRDEALNIFPGINDKSHDTQLTLLPGVAVVEHDLVSNNLEVIGNATVKNLNVSGSIITGDDTWSKLVTDVGSIVSNKLDTSWQEKIKADILDSIVQSTSGTITTAEQDLQTIITKEVAASIANEIPKMLAENNWSARVSALTNQVIAQQVSTALDNTKIDQLIKQTIEDSVALNQDQVMNLLPGIRDQSTAKEMTLMPGTVVVENDFVTRNLEAVETATVNHLTVSGDFSVLGSINTNNPSWNELAKNISKLSTEELSVTWKVSMMNDVVNSIKEQGIDINNAFVNGMPLLEGNKLSAGIKQVGPLDSLTVTGESEIGPLSVTKNRLGINTSSPEMALSVWDEEVSIVAGKLGSNRAYIGTSRLQNLAIGVNNQGHIELDKDGVTSIKKLKIGHNQVGHSTTVPNWSGAKGDIIFNSNVDANGAPFAWMCLGAFKWLALKSA